MEKNYRQVMWTYDTDEKKIVKEEIWLQFTIEEAIKWKNQHLMFFIVNSSILKSILPNN